MFVSLLTKDICNRGTILCGEGSTLERYIDWYIDVRLNVVAVCVRAADGFPVMSNNITSRVVI